MIASFSALGLGDGGVALGRRDQGLAQGVDIALGVAEFLEREGEQDEAHLGEVLADGLDDLAG